MSDAIDKSLLARLQALRGDKKPQEPRQPLIKFTTIERAKSPTSNDILAARLKSLREAASSSALTTPKQEDESNVEELLVSDDAALEEMLAEPEDDDDPVVVLEQFNVSMPDEVELPCIPDAVPGHGCEDLDVLTARMNALKTDMPSVPASKPGYAKLVSQGAYADEDMESWCIVCLEDATLRCLGCDDDVYCSRCWRDMHMGPEAYFDHRSHKAVQFTRNRKKVALGA